jgi:hypothetical protein
MVLRNKSKGEKATEVGLRGKWKKPKSDSRIFISDLQEIKEQARFKSYEELSVKYNISPFTIREIVRGGVPKYHFCVRKIVREISQPKRIQRTFGV